MKPELVRLALLVPGLKPTTSRLLTYMTDVARNGLFYERRERTAHMLGINPDTIKAALAELIAAGYVTQESPAVAGKRPRTLRLHPERWPTPEPLATARHPPDLEAHAPPWALAPPAPPAH